MQEVINIIPAAAVSRLKKQAKRLQRETRRPHHELLEQVAVEAGFQNWHQVTLADAATQRLEKRLRSTLVILMDVKEAEDLPSEFEDAGEVVLLRDAELISWARQAHTDNSDGTDEELRSFLDGNFRCLRYTGTDPLPTLSSFPDWFSERSFWPPALLWSQGKLIDLDAPESEDEAPYDDDDVGPDEPMPAIGEDILRKAFGTSTAQSQLVLNSPDKMERYKGVVGPRKAWNWCLHCERAYPQGSYRQQGELQMCPYSKCSGDSFMDLWRWSEVRSKNPAYPETPELGTRYPLYGGT